VLPALAALLLEACSLFPVPRSEDWRALQVTATAYNSLPGQGQGDSTLAASGVRLWPGMRIIAVSRDLYRMGLREGTRVRIEELPGEWRVADKMHRRWRRRIDIYMGTDLEAAQRFGKKSLTLHWCRRNCG
jgi:3D (Asp-Asp-Asp) domain-containing protein